MAVSDRTSSAVSPAMLANQPYFAVCITRCVGRQTPSPASLQTGIVRPSTLRFCAGGWRCHYPALAWQTSKRDWGAIRAVSPRGSCSPSPVLCLRVCRLGDRIHQALNTLLLQSAANRWFVAVWSLS